MKTNYEPTYEPTPIQRQIEMAVTNGRGYMEKDETRYASDLLRFRMIDDRAGVGYKRLSLEASLSGDLEEIDEELRSGFGEWEAWALDVKSGKAQRIDWKDLVWDIESGKYQRVENYQPKKK